MRDDFQIIAHIRTWLQSAVASEVAIMGLLRSSGLPIPKVYGYSPEPDNAAGTGYFFMEFVRGAKLSDVWFDLGEREVISVVRRLISSRKYCRFLSLLAEACTVRKTWRKW